MDLIFHLLDPEWPLRTVGNWVNTSLRMDQQGDLYVLFLTCYIIILRIIIICMHSANSLSTSQLLLPQA